MRRNASLHIAVVVSITCGCLHQNGLGHARLCHGSQHVGVIDRSIFGPIGLLTPHGGKWVAVVIVGNHMAVQINNGQIEWHVNSLVVHGHSVSKDFESCDKHHKFVTQINWV